MAFSFSYAEMNNCKKSYFIMRRRSLWGLKNIRDIKHKNSILWKYMSCCLRMTEYFIPWNIYKMLYCNARNSRDIVDGGELCMLRIGYIYTHYTLKLCSYQTKSVSFSMLRLCTLQFQTMNKIIYKQLKFHCLNQMKHYCKLRG